MRKILIVPNFIFSLIIMAAVIVPALLFERIREKNKFQKGFQELIVPEF